MRTQLNTCLFGDCRDSMRKMIADGVKVQTCVTSPPYFGLRDYGVDGQLGLESTPQEYVANMVEVFRLVRELLRDDGTLWLNLGDSYAGSWGNAGGHNRGKGTQREIAVGSVVKDQAERNGSFVPPGARGFKDAGIKPKDLIGIPWRVAFALQADGWYLRQDIIWSKPNPMPESVTDRCTKSHEYIFLLSKSERYYYDHVAIKEPQTDSSVDRAKYGWNGRTDDNSNGARTGSSFKKMAATGEPIKTIPADGMRNKRSVWEVATQPYSGAHFATFPPALIEPCILAGSRPGDTVFDPFLGSGTTAQVSQKLGRNWLGCELNPNNTDLQNDRTRQNGLLLEATA